MSRRRFYVPKEAIRGDLAVLPAGQTHHLRNVLRLGTGDTVEIFDGEGNSYIGQIELHGHEGVVRSLQKMAFTEPPGRLVLAAALIKAANFELVLQKATELGVSAIVPLVTRFSEIRIAPEKIDARLERWRRIISEAAKQCRRAAVPRLSPPIGFSEFLSAQEYSSAARVLFYEQGTALWPADWRADDHVVLCVGPEGGWDPGEVEQAEHAGFEVFSLGPLILRAETAAIAAVAIFQHKLGHEFHRFHR